MKFLAIITMSIAPCFGAIIFNDNFDASLGATQLNADIPGWNEVNGTIDYIQNGAFGLACLGAAGGCIDLDGSTTDAGDLVSTTPFNLLAGNTYVLTYWISGNQRSGTDTLTVSFGGQTNTHTAIASSDPFTQFSITVTPLANTSSSINFSHAGGDNLGIMLDSVELDEQTGIPEPATMAMLAAGLAATALLRRR